MIAAIAQWGTLFSVVAFLLLVRANSDRRYRRAWFIQFCAQPFWLASTFVAGQWAMFLVSIFFTVIAMHGVMRFHLLVTEANARRIA